MKAFLSALLVICIILGGMFFVNASATIEAGGSLLAVALPSPSPHVKGDLNVDYKINAGDFTLLTRILLGTMDPPLISDIEFKADVNEDGIINVADLTYMRRYILNLIDTFPKSTIIRPVDSEPVKLTKLFGSSFGIKLTDSKGNPLAGKTVHWNVPQNLYLENSGPIITDSNGIAVFSFLQAHSDYIPYKEFETSWWISFEGDKQYNPCEYNMRVTLSNGGSTIVTPYPEPTP